MKAGNYENTFPTEEYPYPQALTHCVTTAILGVLGVHYSTPASEWEGQGHSTATEGCIRDMPAARCSSFLTGINMKIIHFRSDIWFWVSFIFEYHLSMLVIHLHFLHHLFWVPAVFMSNILGWQARCPSREPFPAIVPGLIFWSSQNLFAVSLS